MKKLRLLIAKWALEPSNITLEDLSAIMGIDFKALILEKTNEQFETELKSKAHEFVEKGIVNQLANIEGFSPELLGKIISVNKQLTDNQKLQMNSILQSPKGLDYLR